MPYLFMLVDDNEGDHFLNEYSISSFDKNIDVIKAYNGQDALDKLSTIEKQPDYIFLDLNMPKMDGFEFLSKYYERPDASASIVILSSSSLEADKQKASVFDKVISYCSKPLKTEDLHSVMNLQTAH